MTTRTRTTTEIFWPLVPSPRGRGSLFSRRSGCRCAGRPVRLGSPHDMVDPGLARNDPASVVPRLERLFPLWHEQPGGGEESGLSGRPQPPRRVGLHGGGGGLREGSVIQPALRGVTPRIGPGLLR